MNYSKLTELATPFGDLFLKVADFQFKYVKEMLEKEKNKTRYFTVVKLSPWTILSSMLGQPSRGVSTFVSTSVSHK